MTGCVRTSPPNAAHRFVPPVGAFTRSIPIRFSHCDPAGIVYFPHYFNMFNGLIEDWYAQELRYDYVGTDHGQPSSDSPSFTSSATSKFRAGWAMSST